MKKRVIIIHGWADSPDRGWLKWLAIELEKSGVEVLAPAMPSPKQPNLRDWELAAAKAIGRLDKETVLVGHSLGTFTLLRALENYQGSGRANKLILVAGFVHGDHNHDEYFSPSPNIENVKSRVDHCYHIYSDNDHMVKPIRSQELADQLGGESFELESRGHFLTKDNVDFPLVLDIIQNY